jgi:hypothetical protein
MAFYCIYGIKMLPSIYPYVPETGTHLLSLFWFLPYPSTVSLITSKGRRKNKAIQLRTTVL